MISYEKAKMGKQLMKQFIAEGELEKAALSGLMDQMPIRIGDAKKLRKSDLSGRNVLKISAKCKTLYEPAWQSLSDHQTAEESSKFYQQGL